MNTKFFVLAAAMLALGGGRIAFGQYAVGSGLGPASYASGGGDHVDDYSGGKDLGGGKCDGCGDGCRTWDFYGDFLYLRSRDSEVAYAVAIDGPITNPPTDFPAQISPVGVVDLDYQPGFRAGARRHFDACNWISVQYTFFDGSTTDAIATEAPNVIRSIVSHPAVGSAAQDWLRGEAQYDVSFDLIDASFQSMLWCDSCTEVSYLVGVRYAEHEQKFDAGFSINGTESVSTDVRFRGTGLRFGLETDRYLTSGLALYARGYGSLIPGETKATYQQSQSYNPVEVDTSWKAGRIVSIWDLEVGASVMSKCGWYRLDFGYVFSAWANMVQTDEWIQGVQQNSYIDMDSTSTFDGLIARAEVRY